MNHNPLFVSLVSTCDNFITSEENDMIYEQIMSSNTSGNGGSVWLSGDNSPDNSFGTDFCVSNEVMSSLSTKVANFVSSYQREVYQSNHRLQLDSVWYNTYVGSQYQERHNHLPNRLSAIYVVKVPDGSSPVVFSNPLLLENYPGVIKGTPHTCSSSKYHACERDLIVFPSYLPHMVPIGKNKDPRVTVAFNFI